MTHQLNDRLLVFPPLFALLVLCGIRYMIAKYTRKRTRTCEREKEKKKLATYVERHGPSETKPEDDWSLPNNLHEQHHPPSISS